MLLVFRCGFGRFFVTVYKSAGVPDHHSTLFFGCHSEARLACNESTSFWCVLLPCFVFPFFRFSLFHSHCQFRFHLLLTPLIIVYYFFSQSRESTRGFLHGSSQQIRAFSWTDLMARHHTQQKICCNCKTIDWHVKKQRFCSRKQSMP